MYDKPCVNWECTADRNVRPIKNTGNGHNYKWEKYCWEWTCQVNPEPQIPDCDGESKVSTICMCVENKCTVGLSPIRNMHEEKTVTALDVVYALKRQGRAIYGFGN